MAWLIEIEIDKRLEFQRNPTKNKKLLKDETVLGIYGNFCLPVSGNGI